MLSNILEFLKHPVTTMMDLAEKEDTKKNGIKLAIISCVMALIGVITQLQIINKTYSKDGFLGSFRSPEELAKLKSEAIKDAKLISVFFKSFVIYAAVIAVIALILFIIAKLVKSDKKYDNTLSMTNNALIICVAGFIIDMLVSLVYAPLGAIILYAAITYACYTLLIAYKESLGAVDNDNLVLMTTAVLTAVAVILALIISKQMESISSLSIFKSLF